MYKVIIWGLGDDYQTSYNLIKFEELKGNIEIVAVVDENKWYTKVDGYSRIPLKELCQCEYDFIIVSSSKYYNEIVQKAESMGICRDLLIPVRVFNIPCFDFSEYVLLKKNPVSIISDDCWGGKIYHYLCLRFDSPFINFFIYNDDFVKLISNFKIYMNKPLVLEQEGTVTEMPVGSLGEKEEKVYLHFNHAYSFEEAKLEFERRRDRINKNNLFIKMSYGWGKYSENTVLEYDKIPCNKKIFLTPFETRFKSEVVLDYFREEYKRKNLEKSYHIQPGDFIGYLQNIRLLAREYNILRMLTAGEVLKRSN